MKNMEISEAQAFDAEYIAIDWSGAKGRSHPGIAVATCGRGRGAPELRLPLTRHWSRREVADFLLELSHQNVKALVGFDFSFSLPFLDKGAYFPGLMDMADHPVDLWDYVEDCCGGDPEFYGGQIPQDARLQPYFHRAKAKGGKYEKRLRVTEKACREQELGRAESIFHLIGPTQVGLASFAGMRLLRYMKRQNPEIAIWPFDPVSENGLTIVEIYTRLFLTLSGQGSGKIRNWDQVDRALQKFNSDPLTAETRQMIASDHRTDALVSAAGLRHISAETKYWLPDVASEGCLKHEGWTFGVA